MKAFTLFFASIFIILFGLNAVLASSDSGSVNSSDKYAWSENMGWINFACDSCRVNINDQQLSGYAWSDNYGWINLAPSLAGVHNNGEGVLSGKAWGEKVGWIDFFGVTIDQQGIFHGYADGDNSGQISFNCNNDNSCVLSSFRIGTDWRPASTRKSSAASPTYFVGTSANNQYVPMGEKKQVGEITASGYNVIMYVNSELLFETTSSNSNNKAQYILQVSNINLVNKKINFKVSDKLSISLDLNDSKKVDLDGDNIADIEIKFDKLIVNEAEITIKSLSESEKNIDAILDGTCLDNVDKIIKINNLSMYSKLKGRIIINVEDNGRAYYISPIKKEMYFLCNPEYAFSVMHERGFGITNANLKKIAEYSGQPGVDNYFSLKQRGKIFLQVEQKGEAWYVYPLDKFRYYLGRPADAFKVMKGLGLGINNKNFKLLLGAATK